MNKGKLSYVDYLAMNAIEGHLYLKKAGHNDTHGYIFKRREKGLSIKTPKRVCD